MLTPEIEFNDLSAGHPSIVSWNWLFSDLGSSLRQNPAFVFPDYQGGIYPVSLEVYNVAGCSSIITYNVVVKEEFLFYVPNAFTPNGDGHNDYFVPVRYGTDDYPYQFLVFNRWGDTVFSTRDRNDKWNGRNHNTGELSEDGVYVWKVLINDPTNIVDDTLEFMGHVTLVR